MLMIKKSVLIFFHNGYDFDKHIIYIPSVGTNNYMREKNLKILIFNHSACTALHFVKVQGVYHRDIIFVV